MTAKNKICGIYVIISPTFCIYVGQSKNCYYRIAKYKGLDCKLQSRLYNSIMKYGWDAHSFEIIHRCSSEQLDFWEKFYISLFDSFDSDHGLNLTSGGNKVSKQSDETKEKRSATLKNTYATGERKRPIGAQNGMFGNGHKLAGEKNGRFGKVVSIETREKIRQGNIAYNEKLRKNGGRKLSDEHKRKISEANKKPKIYKRVGWHHSEATIIKLKEIWAKKRAVHE